MSSNPVLLFVNPTAGRGRAGRRIDRICELLDNAGVQFETRASTTAGDLERQVCEQVDLGADRIIIAGGDGSVHEAVNGIMRADKSARLGVIPTGTGNDFAKACEIPLDWELATELLGARLNSNAHFRRIDVGRMNDRYFANGAGVGFDAKVTKVARSYRWRIGDLVYLVAIFRCLIDGVATPDMTITSANLSTQGPVTLANISNGAWVGGMFHIAPMADNSDGQLELVIASPVSRLRILSLLPKLIRGEHIGQPEISHAGVHRVTIEASEPVPSHLDGEVGEPDSRFEIEILPAVLDLL
jgi:YegS/Rv2252/BmrU family lipid kinase